MILDGQYCVTMRYGQEVGHETSKLAAEQRLYIPYMSGSEHVEKQ